MNALGYTARQRGTKPLLISVESLSRAIADGATDTVRDLLDAGLSPNSAMNDQKWRPLHLAAEHQRADIAALLLEAGADPNTPDQTGFTPLHLAVDSEADAVRQTGCRPTPGVSRILLEKGADPNRPDKTGASPLDLAESYDYRAFLALVIN